MSISVRQFSYGIFSLQQPEFTLFYLFLFICNHRGAYITRHLITKKQKNKTKTKQNKKQILLVLVFTSKINTVFFFGGGNTYQFGENGTIFFSFSD